jgi:LemA protein
MGIGLILLIVVVVLAVLMIGIYNRLVALRQNCNQAFADIDVQLRQRHDLVPNLVETVKGYAAHESGTLEAVTAARAAAVSAEKTGDPKAMGAAEGVLTQALGRLIAISESYPDLKANQNFVKLQDELSDIENKLAAARRFFNNAVGEYNTGREQFPASMLAGAFGFGPRDFFDLGKDGRATMEEAPQVKFS